MHKFNRVATFIGVGSLISFAVAFMLASKGGSDSSDNLPSSTPSLPPEDIKAQVDTTAQDTKASVKTASEPPPNPTEKTTITTSAKNSPPNCTTWQTFKDAVDSGKFSLRHPVPDLFFRNYF